MATQTKDVYDIRYSADAAICIVCLNGDPVRCPNQEDMDTLPVGPDLTDEQIESLPE